MGTTDAAGDTGSAAQVEPRPSAPSGSIEDVVHGIRSAISPPGVRSLLGWALVLGWVVWLAALWVVQPRVVPQSDLEQALAGGQVTSYRAVAVDESRSGLVTPYRLTIRPADDTDDGQEDGSDGGRPLAVAYWVDSPVAAVRLVETHESGTGYPAPLVAHLQAMGVAQAPASDLYDGPPGQSVATAGSVLLVLSTLVVVLGPRPRRGTRWFWFWLLGGPLSVGVPIFAVAELLRPRYEPEGTAHPRGVAGRWSGLAGFAAGFVLAAAGAVLTSWLTSLSPIWFLRG